MKQTEPLNIFRFGKFLVLVLLRRRRPLLLRDIDRGCRGVA